MAKGEFMIHVRRADERGKTEIDWLDSKHSFSFAEYFDPAHMGFGSLRVINEDIVAPGGGFATHGHRDMEIITYVLEGSLAHKDSLGNGSTIEPGEVQRMSAGTGIRHSEFNHSSDKPVHLLQIWILPNRLNLEPSYEQKRFSWQEGALQLVASAEGREGSVLIHQDADIYRGSFVPGQTAMHSLSEGHLAWLQLAKGSLTVAGNTLVQGDGIAIEDEKKIEIRAGKDKAEFLLFDMNARSA